MKRLLYVAVLSVLALMILAPAALAQSPSGPYGGYTCADFAGQLQAQEAYLQGGAADRSVLDPNGNGIACEDSEALSEGGTGGTGGGPSGPYGLYTCADFADQGQAQEAYLQAGTSSNPAADRSILDPDGDGIACEDLPPRPEGTTGTDSLESQGITQPCPFQLDRFPAGTVCGEGGAYIDPETQTAAEPLETTTEETTAEETAGGGTTGEEKTRRERRERTGGETTGANGEVTGPNGEVTGPNGEVTGPSGEVTGGVNGGGGGGSANEDGNSQGGSPQQGSASQGGVSGAVNDAVQNLRVGRLPNTGGGWVVLLLAGAVLIGGGLLLVRRFSSSA